MKKRPVKAVRAMIRAMTNMERNLFGRVAETPELQQVRSNYCGSQSYKKICPKRPMTSAQIREAFLKKD